MLFAIILLQQPQNLPQPFLRPGRHIVHGFQMDIHDHMAGKLPQHRLQQDDVFPAGNRPDLLDLTRVHRTIPTGFEAPELEGKYFLVTGTGKYFKNVQYEPCKNLGIVRLTDG